MRMNPNAEKELQKQVSQEETTTENLVDSSIMKLSKKDILKIFQKQLPTKDECRALATMYYQVQDYRIQASSQIRANSNEENPCLMTEFFREELASVEAQIKKVLDIYTDTHPIGWTVKQIAGIGPVLASVLISNLDITKAYTAGAYWRFCGLDPMLPPKKKGEKLRYSTKMKASTVFLLGESFIKVKSNKNDVYGHFYDEWKAVYNKRNEDGCYKDRAKEILETKNFGKDTIARSYYEKGMLPPGHIHAMARRKGVSYFISHLFDLEYMLYHHKPSPVPYAIAYSVGHVHTLENPLIPIYEGKYGTIDITSGVQK